MKLQTNPRNNNKHTKRGMTLLEESMRDVGYLTTLTVAADGTAVDGAARLETIQKVFPNVEPIIIEHDGTRPLVAVRTDFKDADDPRARRAALLANRVAELNLDYDIDVLMETAQAGMDMEAIGFDERTLRKLLADAGREEGIHTPVDAEPQIERSDELMLKWDVQTGQMWELGNHRLLCGDTTNPENVFEVLSGDVPQMTFIDPPYNALRSWGKDESHSESRLNPAGWFQNDNMPWDEYWSFIDKLLKSLEGHSVYVCCDWRIYGTLKEHVEAAGYGVRHCIVWVKNVFGMGKRYRFKHEFVIYACRDGAPFHGPLDQADVWEIPVTRTSDHKTPKPVELPLRAIENSSTPGAVVFDGCSGYGTVLMACESSGRKCRAIEIEPRLVAITLQRWADATGNTPMLME